MERGNDEMEQTSELRDTDKTALFITGRPGVGKATVLRNAVRHLGHRAGGFYTEEMRASQLRQGFRIVTLDGESAVLAHVEFRGMPRVGKYGVDLAALDSVGVAAIGRAVRERDLVVV